jgi:hypothetical protein
MTAAFVDSGTCRCNSLVRRRWVNNKKIVLFVCSAMLLVLAAWAWRSYVGHGIAYGDLVGIRGREKDLASIGRDAIRTLWTAAFCEALAVGLVTWGVSDPDSSVWRRLVISFGLAAVADVLHQCARSRDLGSWPSAAKAAINFCSLVGTTISRALPGSILTIFPGSVLPRFHVSRLSL